MEDLGPLITLVGFDTKCLIYKSIWRDRKHKETSSLIFSRWDCANWHIQWSRASKIWEVCNGKELHVPLYSIEERGLEWENCCSHSLLCISPAHSPSWNCLPKARQIIFSGMTNNNWVRSSVILYKSCFTSKKLLSLDSVAFVFTF